MGARLAQVTLPARIRRGVLEVVVDNSIVVQELTFKKTQLIASLAERIPERGIADLRFRIGKTS